MPVKERLPQSHWLALWKEAKKGNQLAATKLCELLRPWTLSKAQQLEKNNHNILPADDFLSAAFAKIPYIIDSYKHQPGGTFFGYYRCCAARAMTEELGKALRNRQLIDQRNEYHPPNEAYHDSSTEESKSLTRAMTWLAPFERELIRAMSGDKPQKKNLKNLCWLIQVDEAEAAAMMETLRNKLKRIIENDMSRGRQPCPVTTACVNLAAKRREQNRQWKEILKEIETTYGRKYTWKTLSELIRRKRKREARG